MVTEELFCTWKLLFVSYREELHDLGQCGSCGRPTFVLVSPAHIRALHVWEVDHNTNKLK